MSSSSELLEGWAANLRSKSLTIPRCMDCRHWNWYPRSICTNCGSDRRQLEPVGFRGTVNSWTRVHRALPPVDQLDVPYVVAIIELDDAPGVRIPCRALDPDRDPTIGESADLSISGGAGGAPFLTFSPNADRSS